MKCVKLASDQTSLKDNMVSQLMLLIRGLQVQVLVFNVILSPGPLH
jgi:hypothetical protein